MASRGETIEVQGAEARECTGWKSPRPSFRNSKFWWDNACLLLQPFSLKRKSRKRKRRWEPREIGCKFFFFVSLSDGRQEKKGERGDGNLLVGWVGERIGDVPSSPFRCCFLGNRMNMAGRYCLYLSARLYRRHREGDKRKGTCKWNAMR